ncbi:MAG: aspartate carbamoyltransferase regulatory subunit [Acidobacteriota bacterium]|nr:aspartate carbamoyltransferase regulatory subunit [Acidobacteriota bacterium]
MSTANRKRQKRVAALERGTVIDHLNPGMALKALELIGVPREGAALLGINLTSGKMGRKDILKLENVEISKEQIQKIAVLGPRATVCYIRDYEVVEKVQVSLPERIDSVLRCPNPSCITNHDDIVTCFDVEERSPTIIRCHYCERRIAEDEFVLL